MKLRIISLIAMLMFALSLAAFAYPGAKAAGKNGNRPEQGRICKALGLTDAQSQQIRDIVKKYHTDVKEVAKSSTTKEEKKASITSLRTAATGSIEGVLTSEQLEKAKKTGLIERILSPRKMKQGAGMMKAFVKLDLTEDQKARIKSVFETSKQTAQGIKNDSSLNDEQKKAKLVELRKQTHENVMSILTPEQQEKLKEMKNKKQQRTK